MKTQYLFLDMEIIPGDKENTLVAFALCANDGRNFYAELKLKELVDFTTNELDFFYTFLEGNLVMKDCDRTTIYEIEMGGDTEVEKVKGDIYFVREKLHTWLSEYENDHIQLVSSSGHYDLGCWKSFITEDQSRLSYQYKNVLNLSKKIEDENGIEYEIESELYTEEDKKVADFYRSRTNDYYNKNIPRSNALSKARSFMRKYYMDQAISNPTGGLLVYAPGSKNVNININNIAQKIVDFKPVTFEEFENDLYK